MPHRGIHDARLDSATMFIRRLVGYRRAASMKTANPITPRRRSTGDAPRPAGRAEPDRIVPARELVDVTLLASVIWLKDGCPADRLEQYRHEVVAQLEATGMAAELGRERARSGPARRQFHS